MCPEKTYEGRCGHEVKFVGYLMYGQVGCHNISLGTDEHSFVDPVLGRLVRDGFDDCCQIFRRYTKFVCIIGHTFFIFA